MEVSINPGAEQNVAVGTGARREFPDAVLFSIDKSRKILGIIEVETGESINHLEAMAQWAHYARLKAPFHLYVPMGSADVARRLTVDKQIAVAEIHTYHQIGDMVRFGSAYRSGTAPKLPDDPLPPEPAQKAKPLPPAPPPPPTRKGSPVPIAKTAKPAPAIAAKVEKVVPKVEKLVPRVEKVLPKVEKNGKAAPKPARPVMPVKVAPAVAKKVVLPPKKVAPVQPRPVAKKAVRPAAPPARKAAPKKAAGKRK